MVESSLLIKFNLFSKPFQMLNIFRNNKKHATQILLFGMLSLSDSDNINIFQAVTTYIAETNRFSKFLRID